MKKISNFVFWRKPERKAIRFVAVVFALILAALNLPTTAWAGDVYVFQFNGESANAFFTDATTCIRTDVFVFAFDFKDLPPPAKGGPSSYTTIQIYQWDYCTDGPLLIDAYCFADLADQDFQVSQNLDSATLNAAFECFGFDFVSELPWDFNVDVDLTWTGTGDIIRFKSNSHNSFPGCIFNEQINFTSRPAEASGTVSDETANFTPNPSANANIDSAKIGQVSIDCQ